jgi:glycosyltransferase involved in cell wall biosynthesis
LPPLSIRVSWADEILVIDSFSSDETVAIADKEKGARVLQRNLFDTHAKQKNFAIEQAVHFDWIFHSRCRRTRNARTAKGDRL